jgi:HK97 gp10 family phage protein
MARESVTATGLAELKRAIDAFPRTVTLALRGVAWHSARRIRTRAQQILRSKTHGTGKTANSIEVIEEEKSFLVHVAGDPDRPANLPLWLERGTRHMAARPYMRPASDEEEPTYKREMEQAAIKVAEEKLR